MIKKIKNKKIEFILLLIVIFQIFLLINMATAHSYIIHQTDSLIENQIIKEKNKSENLINSGINLFIGFLSIKQIGFVSAQDLEEEDVEMWCCPEMENGAICDDILSTETENCEVEVINTTCEYTDECRRVCCFDPEEGLCSTNSPKGKCISDEGEWDDDETCSISECRKGCCVLGGNVQFTTERNCEKISSSHGFDLDFRQIWNELDCLALAASQFRGACVFSGGACKFETEVECLTDGGRFYKDFLCSHESLDTNCEKQNYVDCTDGKDEIYWFDSCGNRENIYSSNKDASWNNGFVLKKSLSCGADSSNGNIDSTNCGNCFRPLSKCSETEVGEKHVQDGNFICADLGCKNAPDNVGTQDRINGEKWCLYDGYIGEGKDTVGSEHWLAYCHEGEVEVDRCGEYRSYLCQQQIIEEGDIEFSTAACVPNEGIECHEIWQRYYDELDDDMESEEINEIMEEMVEECGENEHCIVQGIHLDDGKYFNFDMCLPKYPKGAILTDAVDDNLCGLAGNSEDPMQCKVYYEKEITGWKCIENCDCETDEFAEQMNNLCISMGDCGSYINYVGGGTNNVDIDGKYGSKLDDEGEEKDEESSKKGDAPDIYPWENYVDYKDVVEGQYVGPQDMGEFWNSVLGNYSGEYTIEDDYNEDVLAWAGGISGLTGLGFTIATLTQGFTWGAEGFALITPAAGATMFAGLANAFVGFAIGAVLGSLLADWFDISGDAATWMIFAGGFVGAGVGLILVGSGWMPGVGWVLAAIGALIILIIIIFGIGTRETRIVEFECQPWVAPNGGSDCDKCNDDLLRPCTEYRCSSLGQLCHLLNENEEYPACISMEHESNPPVLSTVEVLTEDYEFEPNDFQNKRLEIVSERNDGCISELTPISFKLETDEYAQCQYSFERPSTPNYEDMDGESPYEGNLFTINHTFGFDMPSIDDENIYDIEGDEEERTGQLNMYIKCQDGQDPPNFNFDEYIVKFCVHSGPDETAVDFSQVDFSPRDNTILKYETNETDLKIWTPERAECHYDVEDKDYENMGFSMEYGGQKEFRGWPYETTLENLVSGKNEFYFRCNDTSGNINRESYVYTLYVSESELKINSISFSYDGKVISSGETFIEGFEPISVDMRVRTSGGAEDGESTCWWSVSESGSRWLFYNTFSDIHEQILSPRFDGTHTNYIYCEDEAENNASAVTQFTIDVDNIPPMIIRAYKDGGQLELKTNEDAKCYYSSERCNFELETGTPITTAFSTTHTTKWNPGVTYYIKCKDLFENPNPDCAIKIIPSS